MAIYPLSQPSFFKRHLLSDSLNYLDRGTRKQVFTKTFMHVHEIDAGLLKTFLFEAVEIDSMRVKGR